jgi:hypothetical protein
VNFVNFNKWAQIDGGGNDKMWVNDRYENKFYNNGTIYEEATGETYHFPVCDIDDDPLGIGFHYEVNGEGTSYKIRPNMFVPCGNSKQRRKWKRKAKSVEKWKEHNEHAKLIEENNQRVSLLSKHTPSQVDEIEKSIVRQNEINRNITRVVKNRPPIAKVDGTNNENNSGIRLHITEKQHSDNVFESGPTPEEAYDD